MNFPRIRLCIRYPNIRVSKRRSDGEKSGKQIFAFTPVFKLMGKFAITKNPVFCKLLAEYILNAFARVVPDVTDNVIPKHNVVKQSSKNVLALVRIRAGFLC